MLAFVHELIYCTYLLWLASLVQIVRPPILSHFSDRPHSTTRFSTIKKDNIFSTTLRNHISERNLKWRNLCGKLRRALALSLILQIYSLTKLDNKIVFFFLASLSQFRSHYLSDLRQKFRKWKFQIKTRIGKVRHCPLSTVTSSKTSFLKIMITSIIVIWWSSFSRLSTSLHLLRRSRTSSSRCRWKRAWSLCWSLHRSPGWASSWNNLWCLSMSYCFLQILKYWNQFFKRGEIIKLLTNPEKCHNHRVWTGAGFAAHCDCQVPTNMYLLITNSHNDGDFQTFTLWLSGTCQHQYLQFDI